ncbi:putative MFS transporter [Phaeosphaeria sp. MPI-PUGE-AT-0046c]|nr:putative MFS transporter [Phaeosphaeria sp. MPI-PUGE-AT-0046c]
MGRFGHYSDITSPHELQLPSAMRSKHTEAAVAVAGTSHDPTNNVEQQHGFHASATRIREEKALVKKQDVRILPLSALCYLILNLDRSNIGNAKTMNATTHNDLLSETHMSDRGYTISLMIYLIIYALAEVPSNYLLKMFAPSTWIAFLMFSWGAITIGIAGVQSYATVAVTRFLLGLFEAGLFPAIVYHITFWYRAEERSLRIALIIASATLASAFGGAIAFGVGHMNGVSGLAGFRWLFIFEGVPTCLASLLIYFCFPDYPETSKWLTEDEKTIAKLRLECSQSSVRLTWKDFKDVSMTWRLYVHYAIYFGVCCPFSSLAFFTPTITAGLGFKGLQSQLMTVPPYAVAYVVMVTVSWSADRFDARALHSAALATAGACGFIASATLPLHAYKSRYACLVVATSGAFSCIPPLLGWLSANLHSSAHVGVAIALNIAWGTPGQILGVWIYKKSEQQRGYPTGHWTNAGLLIFVAIACLSLRFYYRVLNQRNQNVAKVFIY